MHAYQLEVLTLDQSRGAHTGSEQSGGQNTPQGFFKYVQQAPSVSNLFCRANVIARMNKRPVHALRSLVRLCCMILFYVARWLC